MKYKNRLIVPTLISTALFGTALNAEAEEMSKESQETLIEAETIEAQTTEDTQKTEEQTPYINPTDVEPAEEATQKESPSVEEEPAQVSIEEETVETLEEPTIENTEDEASQATPVPTSEGVSTEEAGDESVEAAGSEENNELDPVEEEPQTLSETSSEDEGQQENEPAAETVIEDSEVEVEKASSGTDEEQSTESVKEDPETSTSEEEDGDDTSNPQTEASIEEADLKAELEHDKSPEEKLEQVEDDGVSSNEENNGAEVDKVETSEKDESGSENEVSEVDAGAEGEQSAEGIEDDTDSDDEQIDEAEADENEDSETEEMTEAELETSEDALSKEAEALKEDADDIVVDETMEKELLTMLRSYDIEMDESKSFFTSASSAQPMTLAQAVGNINDYIKQNNFKAPRITYNHIAGLPKYNYRNGIGKPEGVVLHETANDYSTINGEINWMSRNYNNAFVHAFVDKDNIIQVADTDHLAWGAGPNANPRFMHVELVRHDNKHDFAKSINNYTDYIANLLYKYKLPVDSAEADANGTLWSHKAISTHLGGTNHIDPYTYFDKFGYSYRDVENLIEEKYMDLYNKKTTPKVTMPISTEEAKHVGRIHNSNKGLYESVTDVKTHSADDHVNKTYYVTRKATYNYDNYYLVQRDLEQGYVGWVHEDDLRTLTRTVPKEYRQSFSVKNPTGYFFDMPWGTGTQRESLEAYSKSNFISEQIMKIDNTDYLFGQFDGFSGWVKRSDLEEAILSAPSPESSIPSENINAARFKDASQSVVYKSYKDKQGTVRPEFSDYTLFTKERVDYNGSSYYSLYNAENDSFVGWAKEDNMHVYSKSAEVSHKKDYIVNNLDKPLLSVAFGDEKQQIGNYRDIGSYLFSAQKKVTVGALDYYYGSVGGQTGWAHYRHVTPLEAADHEKVSDSSAARTRSTSSDIIYTTPYSIEGSKSSTLDDRTFFTKEKVTFKGEDYYSLHNPENDKLIGWMKDKDLITHDRTAEKKHVKHYVVDNLDKHLLDVAFGDEKQRTGTYRNIGSHLFTAQKHVRVGSLDYYYGKVGNTYGWAHYAHVTPLDEVHHVRTDDQNAVRLKSSGDRMIKAQPYDITGKVDADNMDRTFYTKERIEWKDNVVYSIHDAETNKVVGWAEADNLSIYSMSDAESHNVKYIVDNVDKPLLTAAFGDTKQQVDSFRNIGSYLFEAEKRVKVGSLYYYYGKINNKYGWAHYAHVTPESAVTVDRTTKNYAGRVNSRLTNGLYTSVYDIEGKSNTSITDTTLFTKERVRFKNRELYSVYDDIDGRFVGWLNVDDLSLIPRSTVKKTSSNFVVSDGSAYLFTAPYGTAKQRINQLGSLGNDKFDAEKAVTIDGATYYYGRIGNTSGWVAEGSVGEYIVENIKYGMTLKEAVDIQMNLRAKPQAWVSGGGWRDATRSEVEYYLNPANHTTDVWDYTYLDLNRAQNISTVELNNKLLANKGILHNQGTAFLQAANTHGVNEVYLISHALHETGNGTSQLAQGVRLDENGNISENGKLYYNMYGIAAYDHNPVLEGARYAQRMGWDTPAKAVIGGAQFISGGYFNRGQNTLYAMRWNPAAPGTYQYATDVNWAYATARNLKNYYDQLGIRGQYYTRYTF
ncbi:glucosaminidase domain-containing protein [Salinicoccus roseus]|uniref:N-acetylmuramoyl-L-alanine amidase n=1 Tax=Salinicoccus roseus TaxID=45670 RepID=UPI001CA76BF8|nr:N-acetylmuramoyl-L-alanine amidase [Salinicoccus roseus]MBY8908332.1 glucosaminidase domain-containing protein [Salinicoccus roseus]